MRPGTLRVAVVSEHELTRAGLAQLLGGPLGHLVVNATTQHVLSMAPDVIVYDLAGLLDSPESGLERLLASGTPIVALKPHGRPDIVERALRLRVAHFVGLDVTGAQLLTALEQAVATVGAPPGERGARAIAELMAVTGLTSRELDVLVKVAAGLSNRQIGAELSLSVNSIKTYIRTAYRKVHVTNRVGAVLWAVHHGLAPLAARGR